MWTVFYTNRAGHLRTFRTDWLAAEFLEPMDYFPATGFFERVYEPISIDITRQRVYTRYAGLRRSCPLAVKFDPARLR